jgi:hypothetical protein
MHITFSKTKYVTQRDPTEAMDMYRMGLNRGRILRPTAPPDAEAQSVSGHSHIT